MTDFPITPPPELFEQWQFMTPSLALKAAYRAARRPPAVPETIEVDGYTYRLVK